MGERTGLLANGLTENKDLKDEQIQKNTNKAWWTEYPTRLFEQLILRANTILSATMILFLSSLSIFRSPPFSGRSFTLYSLFLNYPDCTLIHHLSPHLTICLISHLLWLSVNGDGWNCTIQRSSPHKCGQKSCCSAFNAVVAAFASRYFCILIIFACA